MSPITSPPSASGPRRGTRLLTVVLALCLVTGIAACSDDSDGGEADGGTSGEKKGVEAEAGAFPVTIEHKYGSTEITEQPERVVAVGLTEQDALVALGVRPVATTEWFGEYEGAIWPWAQEAAAATGDEDIEVLKDADGIDFEQVAAQRPDVIVGLYAALSQEDYDTLAKIAPTVAQPGEYVDYGIPWQELTQKVGQIVGRPAAADEMIAEVEALFEEAKTAHPEFEGSTAAVATPYEGNFVYGREDPRSRFVESLGMMFPDELQAALAEEFGGELSAERADLLDLDVVVWLDPEDAEGELGGPVYPNLAVHTEGREVFLDSESEDGLGGAMSFVTVLSLPYLIEEVVPMLAVAVDGDPATAVPAPS